MTCGKWRVHTQKSNQLSIIGRVSRWFKNRFSSEEDLPLLYGQTEAPSDAGRSLFAMPWGRKPQDLSVLQSGLSSMTALMTSLRQYLDQQNARHEELLTYLSQLSGALQSIPDSSRMQGETLRVLHQQIAYQNAQHKQISEMMRKMTDSSGTQHEMVEMLRDRVETLYKNDEQISQTIEQVGSSMTVVTQNSQTNTLVLERLRDNLVTRDGDLERSLRKQWQMVRVTLLVSVCVSLVAIVLAVALWLYSWNGMSRVTAEPSRPHTMGTTAVEVMPELDKHPATLPATQAATQASTMP